MDAFLIQKIRREEKHARSHVHPWHNDRYSIVACAIQLEIFPTTQRRTNRTENTKCIPRSDRHVSDFCHDGRSF